MATFGEQLRAERERLGVSLEALCAETKISAHHVLALEQDNFGALPGGIFRKGFVRAYITVLHLEEQDWLARFESSHAAYLQQHGGAETLTATDLAEFAENVRRNRPNTRRRMDRRWLGILALFVALGLASWAIWYFIVRARLAR